MLIRSNFKDYYDVGQAHDQDRDLIFDRFPKCEDFKHYPFRTLWRGQGIHRTRTFSVESFTIGFCGSLHPLLRLHPDTSYDHVSKTDRAKCVWAYATADVDTFVRTHWPTLFDHYAQDGHRFESWNKWDPWMRRQDFVAYFTGALPYKSTNPTFDKNRAAVFRNEDSPAWRQVWFTKHRSPVFVACYAQNYERKTDGFITYNAELKPYEFYRVHDAYQTYQQVRMWLANQAVPMKPIPVPDDKTMAEIKGFDKHSFRKDPSSKKRRL